MITFAIVKCFSEFHLEFCETVSPFVSYYYGVFNRCVVVLSRFRNVVFEISSVDVGKFEVSGRFLGRQIEKVELVFQVRGHWS